MHGRFRAIVGHSFGGLAALTAARDGVTTASVATIAGAGTPAAFLAEFGDAHGSRRVRRAQRSRPHSAAGSARRVIPRSPIRRHRASARRRHRPAHRPRRADRQLSSGVVARLFEAHRERARLVTHVRVRPRSDPRIRPGARLDPGLSSRMASRESTGQRRALHRSRALPAHSLSQRASRPARARTALLHAPVAGIRHDRRMTSPRSSRSRTAPRPPRVRRRSSDSPMPLPLGCRTSRCGSGTSTCNSRMSRHPSTHCPRRAHRHRPPAPLGGLSRAGRPAEAVGGPRGSRSPRALGPDARLVDVLVDRLDAPAWTQPTPSFSRWRVRATSVRTRTAGRSGAMLAERLAREVTVGFLAAAEPRLGDAVAHGRADGPRVIVANYLLAPGYFHDLAVRVADGAPRRAAAAGRRRAGGIPRRRSSSTATAPRSVGERERSAETKRRRASGRRVSSRADRTERARRSVA